MNKEDFILTICSIGNINGSVYDQEHGIFVSSSRDHPSIMVATVDVMRKLDVVIDLKQLIQSDDWIFNLDIKLNNLVMLEMRQFRIKYYGTDTTVVNRKKPNEINLTDQSVVCSSRIR